MATSIYKRLSTTARSLAAVAACALLLTTGSSAGPVYNRDTINFNQTLDPALYKSVITSRGTNYSYYFSPADDSKPTLAFYHGYPGTSKDWRRVIPYFQSQGYGILAPDMLGYAGTDQPTDPEEYLMSLISKDMVDILDAENLGKVITIGHDWGSTVNSRLANYYPERVSAYVWLAVPYFPQFQFANFSDYVAFAQQQNGYDERGYWYFMAEDDADSVFQAHIDSWVNIAFPLDPTIWKTRFTPAGALKASLEENFSTGLPAYFSEQDKEDFVNFFRVNHFTGPNNWYKIYVIGLGYKDDLNIPAANAYPPVSAPILYIGGSLDEGAPPSVGNATFQVDQFKNHDITLKEYSSGHWIALEKPDELIQDLEAFIVGHNLA